MHSTRRWVGIGLVALVAIAGGIGLYRWLAPHPIPLLPRPATLRNGAYTIEFQVEGAPEDVLRAYSHDLVQAGWMELGRSHPGVFLYFDSLPCQRAMVTARPTTPLTPTLGSILRVETRYGNVWDDSGCS